MIRKLAKVVGYSKAPKRTFALLHPFRAAKLGAAFWLGKKLFGGSRKRR
jgi:hypothetical protein